MLTPEEYISKYYSDNFPSLSKAPTNKYSNMNFSRLTPDRKQAVIDISLEFKDKICISERVEWDLNDHLKSPAKFAKLLCDKMRHHMDDLLYEHNLRKVEQDIYEQLLNHVDKNTFFPRMRLLKRENEGATNQSLCMNCNSLIFNQEYCVNCMYLFEKKNANRVLLSRSREN